MVVSVCNLKNAAKAAHYYEAENYYAKNEGIEQSEWYGKSAVLQGLSDKIKPQQFEAALHGKAPNGTQLIADRTNRRLGTDLTFSAPKSVSIEALVKGDARIVKAHTTAVKAALDYVERELIQTRVTRKKQTHTQKTGNIQVALWQHDTSRQLDPQLHTHCVILNQTQCRDRKWRTIDNSSIFQNQLLVGAIYHNALAHELQQLGYKTEWNADATFELAGYTETQLAQFSSRRHQIVAAVGAEASAQKRAFATLQTRSLKQSGIDHSALQHQWQLQAQAVSIEYASYHVRQERPRASSIIQNAQAVLLERDVAFSDKQLFREALRQNQGSISQCEIEQEIQRQQLEKQLLTTKDGRLTTAAALERERIITSIAKRGKAKLHPITTREAVEHLAQSKNFTPGQRAALELATTSTDRVILIQGDAGTGKTYALSGLLELKSNQQLRGLAPSAEAAVALETESGIPSQTLDSYLLSPNTPNGETLILDEAGLMSSRQALALLSKAEQHECRVILIGDTKQLSSVEAGCPFRLLQRAGGQTAYMTEGKRQKDPQLKAVIDLAAGGKIAESYNGLEQSGRIAQIADRQERTAAVASDYLSRTQKERSQTLILAGTNQERDEITSVIREGLLAEGSLSQKSVTVQVLKNKNLDSWSKKQAAYYELGDIVTFNVDYKNFHKREPYCVTGTDPSTNTITLTDIFGKEYSSNCTQNVNREVYQLRSLELRVGDSGRFTKNNKTRKQINGQAFSVTDINPETGEITLYTKGWSRTVRAADLVHADYNYVSTTYSSQGKTKDSVLWSADTASAKLLGKEAYYVAVSRVRHDLKIYTNDTEALSRGIVPSRAKANASELIGAKLDNEPGVQPAEVRLTPQTAEVVEAASQTDSLKSVEREESKVQNEPRAVPAPPVPPPKADKGSYLDSACPNQTPAPASRSHAARTKKVIQIAKDFLHNMGVSEWNAGEKGYYNLAARGEDYLHLESKRDRRGTLLLIESGQIKVNQLAAKDFAHFDQVSAKMQADLRQQQQAQLAAQEQQLNTARAPVFFNCAANILKHQGTQSGSERFYETEQYKIIYNRPLDTLRIEAKDGRGEILTNCSGQIERCRFTTQDFLNLHAIQQNLEQYPSTPAGNQALAHLSVQELKAQLQQLRSSERKRSWCPRPEARQELARQVEQLQQQKAVYQQEAKTLSEELETANNANFLNKLFRDPREIERKQDHLNYLISSISGIDRELWHTTSRLQEYQAALQKEREWQAWDVSPQTAQMRQRQQALRTELACRQQRQYIRLEPGTARCNETDLTHALNVGNTARSLLVHLGHTHFEGQNNDIKVEGDILTVTTKHGRGDILKIQELRNADGTLTGKLLHSNLSADDVQQFQRLQNKIDQDLERQRQSEQEQSRSRNRGIAR